MILLIVLMVISLITGMAASLFHTGQTTRQSVNNDQQRLQAKWQLLGAEAAVTVELQRQLRGNNGILPDAVGWLQPHELRVNGGEVHYVIRDLDACFNLNWLLASVKKEDEGSQAALAPNAWFQQLLRRTGAGRSISVQKLRDMLQGYQFLDPSQLLAVADIPSAAWQRLLGQICVVNRRAEAPTLNVNGLTPAQIPLLQTALKNQVDGERLRKLLASRPGKGWKNQKQISEALLDGLPVTTLFRYNSNDYRLTLDSGATGGNSILYTYLHYENQKMHVVYRRFENNVE
ncbi:general secretion pathway protein GspK [Symbiopectobacterium purcellii]|uniref:general secretion pathway protein GspK n=1 Tax=Symbiopectobacterium purcellii TaxID=2871826 RepID=UPI003F83F118